MTQPTRVFFQLLALGFVLLLPALQAEAVTPEKQRSAREQSLPRAAWPKDSLPEQHLQKQASSDVALFPDFSVYRLGDGQGPTLLVVGGIQGDEPGGFSAAALLATHYKISSGSVWVVPNLNFPSIIRNSRGLHGDMNRKFANLSDKDPERAVVLRIQDLITRPEVDLILNLHDGSGFYRPRHESALMNPKRWGQCIVIDQEAVDDDLVQNPRFKELGKLARSVADRVNGSLLKPLHAYHIKDTKTRLIDLEMQKTLSYFAVCQGKAAFGLEASKELDASSRIYYHIQLLEAFMAEMGIEFERDFTLSPVGVQVALNANILVSLHDSRTVLPLENIRAATAGFIPVMRNVSTELPAEQGLGVSVSNPLLAVVPGKSEWQVYYGNRTLTRFRPEYRELDSSVSSLWLELDGSPVEVPMGALVPVNEHFLVRDIPGCRVNAIGANQEVNGTESNVLLKRSHFQDRFSLDKGGNIYRVEVYRDKAYCGMILVDFAAQGPASDPGRGQSIPLTAGTSPKDNTGR